MFWHVCVVRGRGQTGSDEQLIFPAAGEAHCACAGVGCIHSGSVYLCVNSAWTYPSFHLLPHELTNFSAVSSLLKSRYV